MDLRYARGAHWKKCGTWILAVLSATVWSRTAAAIDLAPLGDRGERGSVEVHGFVSPGFILTTGNNYLAYSKKGSFEFTEVGINFTAPITEKLRAGMQLFSRDLGPINTYAPRMDWFYLDYKFFDWFGIRAGRVKLPYGLYNEVMDIDVARVPILLPPSIYSLTNRDFLLAQTGAEIYGRIDLKTLGALEYRQYAGAMNIDLAQQTSVSARVDSINIPRVVGQRFIWETPLEGLRLAGTMQALRIDARFTLTGVPTATTPAAPARAIDIEVPATQWVASAEFVKHDLLIAAEYAVSHIALTSSDSALIPRADLQETTSQAGYVMTSYRINRWFQPGAYYSLRFPDIRKRDGRENVQHDVAGTLRFDLNRNWVFKLEGHFMSGTAGLQSSLNGGTPLKDLERNTGVFLAKTTVFF